MKYNVICTRIYNGSIEVDANSAEEAVTIVADKKLDEVEFTYGETTADYAEIV